MIANTESFIMIAKTMSGLENVLCTELEDIGAKKTRVLNRAVEFEGDEELLYKANMALRTAIRLLVPIHYFRIRRQSDLYHELVNFNWDNFMSINQRFVIYAQTSQNPKREPLFSNTHFLALKAKDALVDFFYDKYGERPSVDKDASDISFHIHIDDRDRVTLMMDSSGDALYKRGYRREVGEAPLNEVLAAGMLLLSPWRGQCDLVDPFCGSGTILVEAAYLAMNYAPNLHREHFSLMNWNDFDFDLWINIKKNLQRDIKPLSVCILGQDIDISMIEKAHLNIENAEIETALDKLSAHSDQTYKVSLDCVDFFTSDKKSLGVKREFSGMMISNPPYGKKLESIDLNKLGSHLKHKFSDMEAWLLLGSRDDVKQIGLKASKKFNIMNAPIECCLAGFSIFSGKRKEHILEDK